MSAKKKKKSGLLKINFWESFYRIINRGDRHTIELSLIAADEVERILGIRPHLVFSHFKR